jgi:FkbM family methyltransferase
MNFHFIFKKTYHPVDLFLFNLYLFFMGASEKVIRVHSKDNKILYKLVNKERYFCNLQQGLTVYGMGITERNQSLLRDYCLDEIDFFETDTVVDIGANVGDLYFALENISNYIAFEPSPLEFNALTHNLKRLHTSTFQLALGNYVGHSTFYLNSNNADNSLIPFGDIRGEIIVKVEKLDNQKFPEMIKLLKIDAEGFEPEVLEGGLRTLQKVKYVSVDVSFERGILKESTLVPVLNLMLKNDFKVSKMNHERMAILFRNLNIE